MNLRTSFSYLTFIFLFTSFGAFAKVKSIKRKSYDIRLELSLNGKKLANPRLIVKEGESGFITYEDAATKVKNYLEVVAKEETELNKGNLIFVDLKLGHLDQSKKKSLDFNPDMLIKNNSSSKLTILDAKTNDTLKIEVLAKKIN